MNRPAPKPASRPTAPKGPPGLAARRAAALVLMHVLDRGRPLDQELDAGAGEPSLRRLPPQDRALVRAILGTTLRRLGEIDAAIDLRLDRPLPEKAAFVRHLLRIGVAQILHMDVADHAAVSIAVEIAGGDPKTRPWKGLVNAILRAVARDAVAGPAAVDPSVNTPDWLHASWTASYGAGTTAAIEAAHLREPTLDLSVKDPAGAAAWAERLGARLLPTGSLRLLDAGAIDRLDGFREGAWWVQDAAAALPARLLGDVRGLAVADLCAAPGGKTAALAAAGATVTAVDVSPSRLKRLTENLARLNLKAETVAADLRTWTPAAPFDAILLDAPCSATGTIRRHPDVARLKSPEDVATLAALQAALIDRALGWLKPGGLLVYCVCSLEHAEGEAQASAALARHPDVARVPVTAAEIGGLAEAITADGDLRTLPSHLADPDEPRLGGLDGFFALRVRKFPDLNRG